MKKILGAGLLVGGIVIGYVARGGVNAWENFGWDGPCKDYYLSGELLAEGERNNGIPVGKWRVYYRNGKLSNECVYDGAGLMEGECTMYRPDGTKESVTTYVSGIADGSSISFDGNERVIWTDTHTKGHLSGPSQAWDTQRRKLTDGSTLDGRDHGLWTEYWPNGRVRTSYNLDQSVLHGKYVEHDEDGLIRVEGEFNQGHRTGIWTWHGPDGKSFVIQYDRDGRRLTE